MFEPDFEVVAKSEAIALFVEYERTFGRGKAFEITHQTTAESRSLEVLSKYGGHSVVTEFEKFAYLVPIVTRSGEAAIANRIIGELKDFRRKYPLLYEDADQHPTAGHPY
ncbi:hypothetical protein A3I95_01355 [Candidatus Nomurabacteria bacterium RIFCSPLOWO2_02_FULL_44_12]|uniref:Uncharacterized protein n=1 Tax=Candidatus Nomurabacteria bacterium RIFCSPLOWO2_12_FULL_44_11 TaxID=1801796 RepID=A0A1F6Y6Z7_9BACT|nr:MAG: hypothetical protein A3E95_01525 [Candidatus Nomurabacteria bacterium RIFCSPHIGHO2_12_FULL_44_22b]OGJ02138.1 MAG: hypothetical protein A3G53_00500 [Candidatus Nomurabacteria bacterium RIFCSPLOWO2_12_FULL_44_11]OGJ08683.1 MAG: hypothetical protein A3I95_01355 [Candidatus Nomurabacteria bacterium RIFCSPLOWO2_02_FULL_44_12]